MILRTINYESWSSGPTLSCYKWRNCLTVVLSLSVNSSTMLGPIRGFGNLSWSVLQGWPTALWSSGFYSRCNISYLEEWLKDKNLQNSLAKETLEPLSQAAWLLQVKKTTDSDAKEIYERCTSLSAVQVTRLAECLPNLANSSCSWHHLSWLSQPWGAYASLCVLWGAYVSPMAHPHT